MNRVRTDNTMAKVKRQKEINDIQNTVQTTIVREERTPQQTGVNSGFSGRMISSSGSTGDIHRFTNSMSHEEDRRTVL